MFVLASTFVSATNNNVIVKNNTVTYAGKEFIISSYNVEEAMEVISAAKTIHAFEVADIDLHTGNSSDFNTCYHNADHSEFAIEVSYIGSDKYVTKYILFSKKGAQVIEKLPEGFQIVEDYSCDLASKDTRQVAGYVNADCKSIHNSFIVYIL